MSSVLPSGAYRTAGQRPGADLASGGQLGSLHALTKGDPYESVHTYSQVVQISPAFIMSSAIEVPASGNCAPNAYNEIDEQFRAIPRIYTIPTALPTPKQGRWRVRLTNYTLAFSEPGLWYGTQTKTVHPTFNPGHLAEPGDFMVRFPSAPPPQSRCVTSWPLSNYFVACDSKSGVGQTVNTQAIAVNQALPPLPAVSETPGPSTQGFSDGQSPGLGWHLPFNASNCKEGIRNVLTVLAETSAAGKLGQFTSEEYMAPGATEHTLDADSGTEHGIPIEFQISRPVYQCIGDIQVANSFLVETTRTAQVYLTWEMTEVTKMSLH